MQQAEKRCRLWVRRYMRPGRNINHMATSTGLRLMMQQDTGAVVTDDQFKRIVRSEGFEPVDWTVDEWEFRITPAALRKRPNAEVGGWLPSMNPYNAIRMR